MQNTFKQKKKIFSFKKQTLKKKEIHESKLDC